MIAASSRNSVAVSRVAFQLIVELWRQLPPAVWRREFLCGQRGDRAHILIGFYSLYALDGRFVARIEYDGNDLSTSLAALVIPFFH